MEMILATIETLFGLTIHNILIGNKISSNFKLNLFVTLVISVVVNPFISLFEVNEIIKFFMYIFIQAMFIRTSNRRNIMDVFSELCIAYLVVLALQFSMTLCAFFLIGIINIDYSIPKYALILAMAIIGGLIILFDRVAKKYKIDLAKYVVKYNQISVFIINLILFLYLTKTFITNSKLEVSTIIQVFIIFLLLIGINMFNFFNMNEKNRRIKKEEINDNINPLIDDIMNKLKANQHEYKNHLNILYCMIQVADEKEIKDKVKKYIGNIITNDDFITRVSRIENTIVKAIVFNNIQKANNLAIEFTYNVESDLEKISLDDSELTVVLSNLLNNAIEGSSESEGKFIDLDIYEEDEDYIIYVKNSIADMKKDTVKNMFNEGYSTKGNGRGYGLMNIKNIIEKRRGDLQAEVVDDFIEFIIKLPM